MPCFHIGGTGWAILGLMHGAFNVIAREFDPTKVLDFIENWRITKLFMVPAALQVVVRNPKARSIDYSQLKYILYGASPMPLALLRECMEVFGCGFVQLYGMTETTGSVTALGPEDHDLAGNPKMSSAGKPLPGVELAILDAAGERVPVGSVGEVAMRSMTNMQGYWKLPQETARTMGADGWLRTGDAGYIDADGYLYIHDRVKDMIISGGENIYPAEVENAIYGHPRCFGSRGHRHSERAVGRGSESGRRVEAERAAGSGVDPRVGARAHRCVQGAEERGLHPGAAEESVGEDSAQGAARAVLAGTAAAGELAPRVIPA